MLPLPGYLFPSSVLGIFQPLFHQIHFQTLSLISFWNHYNVNIGTLDAASECPHFLNLFFFLLF